MANQTVIIKRGDRAGIGILGWMFLILMTLKLSGVINVSWWVVTAPLWGPPVILLGVATVGLAAVGVVFGVSACIDAYGARKRRKAREKCQDV